MTTGGVAPRFEVDPLPPPSPSDEQASFLNHDLPPGQRIASTAAHFPSRESPRTMRTAP